MNTTIFDAHQDDTLKPENWTQNTLAAILSVIKLYHEDGDPRTWIEVTSEDDGARIRPHFTWVGPASWTLFVGALKGEYNLTPFDIILDQTSHTPAYALLRKIFSSGRVTWAEAWSNFFTLEY